MGSKTQDLRPATYPVNSISIGALKAPEWFFLFCSASYCVLVPTKNSIFPPMEMPSPVVNIDCEYPHTLPSLAFLKINFRLFQQCRTSPLCRHAAPRPRRHCLRMGKGAAPLIPISSRKFPLNPAGISTTTSGCAARFEHAAVITISAHSSAAALRWVTLLPPPQYLG